MKRFETELNETLTFASGRRSNSGANTHVTMLF